MKKKLFGLILVRSKSSRLKKKCFLPFGEVNILEHIINRCRFYGITPIVCTSNHKEDDQIIKICKKSKTISFRGSLKNKILRISECCKKLNISEFHTIDADDPFFCGDQVKNSMLLLKRGYDIVKPTIISSNGGASVGFSIKSEVIIKLSKKIKKIENTEMMWFFFNKMSNLKIITLKPYNYEIKDVRLTLDYYEDYIFLSILRKMLGNLASRRDIYFFLKKNVELTKINFFRNFEWKKNQDKYDKKK
jgi:spore coat polysaccharide biosynthesis protein SpsF (cytidylyltransferase family)